PTAVTGGVVDRFAALAKTIKLHPSYTNEIGQDLGIVGPVSSIDLTTVKPTVSFIMIAGKPVARWIKQGLDGIEIWKKNSSGTFVFVDFDPHPDWTDNSTLPATGASALWEYKFIYRENGVQVGQWSDV